MKRLAPIILACLSTATLVAGPFRLPTANDAVLAADGGGERYFVGTAGKPWTSGRFGCVRTDGHQLHEGMDIRPTRRDPHGEPLDPVLCAAPGVVAYVNRRTGLSNYGNYVVVRHRVEGLEVFTLYAHLASVRPGLSAGDAVRAGDPLGVLGRTSNTRQRIPPDRAHLHFEVNLMANARYADWHRSAMAGTRNDHGDFNGRNLYGLDPEILFREQARAGAGFGLVRHLRSRTELCRVLLRRPTLDWARRNPGAVDANPVAAREGIAGWELALAFNGLPLHATPRAASELRGRAAGLLAVNGAEAAAEPCGKLVVKHGASWSLTAKGERLLGLLGH